MEPAAVVDLVAEFLGARGFSQAEAVLRTESGQPNQGSAQGSSKLERLVQAAHSVTAAGDRLQPFPVLAPTLATEGALHPERFVDAFAKLQLWIVNSLEKYKPELSSVSFPLFVLCYLQLVRHQPDSGPTSEGHAASSPAGGGGDGGSGEPTLAAAFLARWGPELAVHYPAEIRALGAITLREHLAASEFAQALLARDPDTGACARFALRLSRVAFELLNSYLSSNLLLLLVGLLNNHVAVTIEDREPVPTLQVAQLQAAPSRGNPESRDLPQGTAERVEWGVLRFPPAPEAQSSASSAAGGDTADEAQRSGAEDQQPAVPQAVGPIPNLNLQYNLELLGKCMLHPNPAFPPNVGQSTMYREANPELVASAVDPSVLFATFVNTYGTLVCMQATSDAVQLAAGFSDRVVRVWRLDRHAQSRKCGAGAADGAGVDAPHLEPIELRAHCQPIHAVSWGPEHRHLLTACADGAVRLFDVATRRALAYYRAHTAPVWDASFSPVGNYFVSASYDRTARMWATDTVYPLRLFVGHYSDVTCARFHPNANYVLTGSCDKSARLWDVRSGKCLRVFTGHFGAVSALAVCPSGRYLATASEDHSVRVWDLGSGRECAELTGHTDAVYSVDYSTDGGVLASGGADGTVRVWDVAGVFHQAAVRVAEHTTTAPAHTFNTKSTPVCHVRWTRRNLLLAGGAFDLGADAAAS